MKLNSLFRVKEGGGISEARIIAMPGQISDSDQRTIAYGAYKAKQYTIHVASYAQSLYAYATKSSKDKTPSETARKIGALLSGSEEFYNRRPATAVEVDRKALLHILQSEDTPTVLLVVGKLFSFDMKDASKMSDLCAVISNSGETLAAVECKHTVTVGSFPWCWFANSIIGKAFWTDVSGIVQRADATHKKQTKKKGELSSDIESDVADVFKLLRTSDAIQPMPEQPPKRKKLIKRTK